MNEASKHRMGEWHRDPANLVTLLAAVLLKDTDKKSLQAFLLRSLIYTPQYWRTEFVIARCRELDAKQINADERRSILVCVDPRPSAIT